MPPDGTFLNPIAEDGNRMLRGFSCLLCGTLCNYFLTRRDIELCEAWFRA
jgi:hypothetical protein